jgi:hypothetical protein
MARTSVSCKVFDLAKAAATDLGILHSRVALCHFASIYNTSCCTTVQGDMATGVKPLNLLGTIFD